MTATAETTAPDVPCPACMAVAGADCLTPSGKQTKPHAARLRLVPLARPIAVDGAGQATTAPETPETPGTPTRADRDDLALQLLVIKVLHERVTGVQADLRAQAKPLFRVGDQVPAFLGDDTRSLGRVGMSKGSTSWKVTDVDKLTAWVEEHHPEEIETRPVIRNSFIGALTASCKAHGGWLNKATGDVEVPPGMELSTGDPTLTVKASDDAETVVTEALAAGLLAFDGTAIRPALPAGEAR